MAAGIADKSLIGELVKSAVIIMTAAHTFTPIIHDRMPVTLDHRDLGRWLAGDIGVEASKRAADDALRTHGI
jgi:putative SOS response-associated peptidase YedK